MVEGEEIFKICIDAIYSLTQSIVNIHVESITGVGRGKIKI